MSGCHLPPRDADAHAQAPGVNRDLVLAPTVRIELLRVNDANVSEDIWDRVMERFRSCVRGDIVITDHGRIELPADDRGDLLEHFSWPLSDEHGPLTVERMVAEGREWLPLDLPAVEGVQLVSMREPEGDLVRRWLEPSVPPNVVYVAILPREPEYEHTGYWRALWKIDADEDGEVQWRRGGSLVTVQLNVISRRAMFGWAQRRLLEWTLFHELGHALGVPADASHVTMMLGVHCTYPHCVMYSPVDLRWVVSLLLNGWPMDLCSVCREEIRVVLDGEDPESVRAAVCTPGRVADAYLQ